MRGRRGSYVRFIVMGASIAFYLAAPTFRGAALSVSGTAHSLHSEVFGGVVHMVQQPPLLQITDAVSGSRLSVPHNMRSTITKSGTNWETADKRLSIDTLRFQDRTLETLYSTLRNKKGRKVTRGELSGSSFVLEGTDDSTTSFHLIATARDGEIRGLSIVCSQGARPPCDAVVAAILKSFMPFPSTASASSQLPGPTSPEPASPRPVPTIPGLVIGGGQGTTAPIVKTDPAPNSVLIPAWKARNKEASN